MDTSFAITLANDIEKQVYVNYYEDARNFRILTCLSNPQGSDIYINDSLTRQKTPHIFTNMWPDIYRIKYTYPEHRSNSCLTTVHAQDTSLAFIELQDTTYAVDYSDHNSDYPTAFTSAIMIGRNDKKWIGARGKGLVYFNDENRIVYDMGNSPLPSNNVNCITEDKKTEYGWVL